MLSIVLAAAYGSGVSCGVERWARKTLQGYHVSATVPARTSVHALRLLPRRRSLELHYDRVRAELLGFKLEADGDIHLILAQPGNTHETMVAEIPNPRCMPRAAPQYVAMVAAARLAFVRTYGIPPYTLFALAYRPIDLAGSTFFDALHGQSGAAPNGVELHPVLMLYPAGGGSK